MLALKLEISSIKYIRVEKIQELQTFVFALKQRMKTTNESKESKLR